MDHGLVVFLVGIPCYQQFCVAQSHPCFRLCEEIIDIMRNALDSHSDSTFVKNIRNVLYR